MLEAATHLRLPAHLALQQSPSVPHVPPIARHDVDAARHTLPPHFSEQHELSTLHAEPTSEQLGPRRDTQISFKQPDPGGQTTPVQRSMDDVLADLETADMEPNAVDEAETKIVELEAFAELEVCVDSERVADADELEDVDDCVDAESVTVEAEEDDPVPVNELEDSTADID